MKKFNEFQMKNSMISNNGFEPEISHCDFQE